jgi:hypothetical protein
MCHFFRWITVMAALGIAGCAGKPGVSRETDRSPVDATPKEIRYPLVQPVLLMPGRIVSVRERLQFVVIDFGIHPLPAPGTILEVHRNGGLVGRLRVSGPESGSQTIADLLEGEAAPGDEAHPVGPGG